MLVALHGVDAEARVRSHFQRLVLMSHLSEVRRRITEDERIEAESHRERDRMSAEDTASLMFIGGCSGTKKLWQSATLMPVRRNRFQQTMCLTCRDLDYHEVLRRALPRAKTRCHSLVLRGPREQRAVRFQFQIDAHVAIE